METMYQRSKIQEESIYYETQVRLSKSRHPHALVVRQPIAIRFGTQLQKKYGRRAFQVGMPASAVRSAREILRLRAVVRFAAADA